MADLISTLSVAIKEDFPETFMQASKEDFPLLRMAEKTVKNVKTTGGDPRAISRLFAVKHGWKTGLAGTTRSMNPYGSAVVDIGPESRILDSSNSDSMLAPIPPAAETPHMGHFTRQLFLHANVGNMGIPLMWQFAESLDAMQVEMLFDDMKACARMTRRQDAISYSTYRATGESTYKVTVLSRILSFGKATHYLNSGSTNANFVDIVIDENYGSIANFMEGMEIDIVKNSGGAVGTAGELQDGVATTGADIANYTSGGYYVQVIVTKVDRLHNTITVMGIDRTTGSADAIIAFSDTTGWQGTNGVANYDWICPRGASTYIAGQRPWLSNGVEDWMASSGTIMGGAAGSGGLDMDEYPQFQSLVVSDLNAPLSESVLNRLLALAAQRCPDVNINALITTIGVMDKFRDELEAGTATSTWNRTNMPFEVKGGWTMSNYVTPTGSYQWWTSPYCLKGHVYGQQLDPANLKLYSPRLVGRSQEDFAEGIQFLGPLLGYPGIIVPESNTTTGTPNLVTGTPWVRFALLCPIMPNGIKITGATESDMVTLLD